MAKKRNSFQQFKSELIALSQSISDDLHLPSLKENRLEGFAHLFTTVLPQLDAKGQPVFTEPILQELVRMLNVRCGGSIVPSSTSHPPFWGIWQPTEKDLAEEEKDYLTTIHVLANPTDAATRFFTQLKQILKTAGNIEQQEILISRTDCWLI